MDETRRPPEKALPLPGETFLVEGRTAFLIRPSSEKAGTLTPWVWYAPTLPGLPGPEETWMFRRFLAAGLAVAGIDVGESFGNPEGRRLYSSLHAELTRNRGCSRKACLLARSRGGLMLYNWAVEHPSDVACVSGIYPVCNLTSYPGVEKASGAYGLTPDALASGLSEHNPIDRIASLASERVPLFHIHGDIDSLVPLGPNSGELAERYRRLAGSMILRVIEGQGHNMWPGWFECQELVDFTIAHADRGDAATSGRG
jgi:hypothetical protein